MLSELKPYLEGFFQKPARFLADAGFTPNHLTICGLAIAVVCFFVYRSGGELLGGVLLLVCGFFDIMDGAVARLTRCETAFGGFLDSVVDRYSDFLVLTGVLLGGLASLSWTLLAILGSSMVSYTRARAEAAGTGKLTVGIAERAERLLILSIFSILGLTNYGIILIAVLSNLTAVQRILVVRSRLI